MKHESKYALFTSYEILFKEAKTIKPEDFFKFDIKHY